MVEYEMMKRQNTIIQNFLLRNRPILYIIYYYTLYMKYYKNRVSRAVFTGMSNNENHFVSCSIQNDIWNCEKKNLLSQKHDRV